MVTGGAGETSWLYMSGQTSMRWWHLNLGLKDEKEADCKDLEKEHSRQREQQTHVPEQPRVWGLLEQNGGQCAWVVRQRDEAGEAGVGPVSLREGSHDRDLPLKQAVRTYCSNI